MFWAIIVLPSPWAATRENIARLGEEVEAQGGLDGGAVDALGPGPIEVAHRGEAAEAAAGEAAFEAAAGTLLLLTLDEMFQELGDAAPAFRGEGDDIVQVRSGVAQAEGGELISEWSHQASPHRGLVA
jgi:hypothetical protein